MFWIGIILIFIFFKLLEIQIEAQCERSQKERLENERRRDRERCSSKPWEGANRYYLRDGIKESGPFTRRQIEEMWTRGQLTTDVEYHTDDNETWDDVENLCEPPNSLARLQSTDLPSYTLERGEGSTSPQARNPSSALITVSSFQAPVPAKKFTRRIISPPSNSKPSRENKVGLIPRIGAKLKEWFSMGIVLLIILVFVRGVVSVFRNWK